MNFSRRRFLGSAAAAGAAAAVPLVSGASGASGAAKPEPLHPKLDAYAANQMAQAVDAWLPPALAPCRPVRMSDGSWSILVEHVMSESQRHRHLEQLREPILPHDDPGDIARRLIARAKL